MRFTSLLLSLLVLSANLIGTGLVRAQEVSEDPSQYATPAQERLIHQGYIFYPAKRIRPATKNEADSSTNAYSNKQVEEIARALEQLGLTPTKELKVTPALEAVAAPAVSIEIQEKPVVQLKEVHKKGPAELSAGKKDTPTEET